MLPNISNISQKMPGALTFPRGVEAKKRNKAKLQIAMLAHAV